MSGPGPTDAQRRLLAAVAQRLPPERMRELHLFAPIRQGGVETGLAVIAVGEPEAEAAAPRIEDAPAGEAPAAAGGEPGEGPTSAEAGPAGPPGPAAEEAARQEGMPALVLSADDEVVRAVVLAAEAAAEERAGAEAPCDPTDDAAGGVPARGDAEAASGDAADAADVVDAVAEPDAPDARPDTPAAAPARFTIYTARYRLQLKGPDRGKWETELVEEADAPLLTVDAVVRGVQRRAGELAEVERLTTADVRRVLAEGA